MISFIGAHYPESVVLYAVFSYVRYGVTICVDGSPQSQLLAIDGNDDFIKMPLIRNIGSITLDAIGKVASEPVHPKPDGFAADNHVTFGKQILHISRAEGKPIIRPNGVTNDLSRKAVAFQARRVGWDFHARVQRQQNLTNNLVMPIRATVPVIAAHLCLLHPHG